MLAGLEENYGVHPLCELVTFSYLENFSKPHGEFSYISCVDVLRSKFGFPLMESPKDNLVTATYWFPL